MAGTGPDREKRLRWSRRPVASVSAVAVLLIAGIAAALLSGSGDHFDASFPPVATQSAESVPPDFAIDPPPPPEEGFVIEDPRPSGVQLANSALREAVDAFRSGSPLPKEASLAGSAIYVDVRHTLPEPDAKEIIEDLGGQTFGSVPGTTVALVPIEALETLERTEGIDYLTLPAPPPPTPATGDTTTHSVGALSVPGIRQKTNATAWHQAGLTGQGVKIGIMDFFNQADWNAAQAAGRLPTPAGGLWCTTKECTETMPWQAKGDHGVSSAEIIHAMAPSASLYIAGGSIGGDVRERKVIDWFASKGVEVISRSLGRYTYSTPGDGTGWAHNNVAYAASKGMVWVNAAGNISGNKESKRLGGHHLVAWQSNNDGTWLLSPSDSIYHPVRCSGDMGLSIRWNDWDKTNPTDFDLYLVDDQVNVLKSSNNRQTGGHDPLEGFRVSCSQTVWLWFLVHLHDPGGGTANDVIQIKAEGGALGTWSNPHGASDEHVDSASGAMIAAGAMEPLEGSDSAEYSSWGPTMDGRIKPDLSAGACIQTVAAERAEAKCQDGTVGANGTSAAAPVISGVAALVLGADEASTPSQVKSYLVSHAVDQGATGPDNVFGAGEVRLPAPPATVDNQSPSWPDKTLTAKAHEREVTVGWSAAVDNVGVTGYKVYVGPGEPIDGSYHGNLTATLGASARSFTVTGLTPGTKYAFWVRAFDAADNQSTDAPLRVRSTAVAFVDTVDSIFSEDIIWLSSTEVTRGCNPPTNDRFCPNDLVTRAQMASFLVRALGLPAVSGFDFFTDTTESVHEQDINTLAFFEITKGCNPPFNDRFCPNDFVTRAQMASFLARALGLFDGWHFDYFADDDNSVHEFDINRLAHFGISRGCNPPRNTLFCPRDGVSRGQMAAFLHRGSDLIDAIREEIGLVGPLTVIEDSFEDGEVEDDLARVVTDTVTIP